MPVPVPVVCPAKANERRMQIWRGGTDRPGRARQLPNDVGGTGIAFARCMACVRTLCLLTLLLGCYQSHRTELADGGPTDGGPTDGARPDVPAADASVPEPCREVAALEPVPITHSPPNDFNLGAIARSPTGGAGGPVVVAYTSSNDASEMDVRRWIRPVDPRTGTSLVDERIVAFGEPRGAAYAGLARVYYSDTDREGIAFTYSGGEGCVLRPIDAAGQPTRPETRIADDACLSARVGPDGNFILFFRGRDDSDFAYFAWLDDRNRIVRQSEPSEALGASRDYDWTVRGGEIHIARGGPAGLEVGRWDVERNAFVDVRVHPGVDATAPRIVLGLRPAVGWLEGPSGAVHFALLDSAASASVGIDAYARAGWSAMWRGDELWLATAEARGDDHAAARVAFSRLHADFSVRDQQVVGNGSFPQRIRMVRTEAGAMIVNQAFRRGLDGGHQIFTTPLHCADAPLPRSCEVARLDPCAPVCDDTDGFVFTIEGCVESHCNCVGPGCAFAHPSRAACEAATSDCDRALCQASSGIWVAPNEVYCDHPQCGTDPADCLAPAEAVCHCGTRARFRPGFGCEPAFDCRGIDTRADLCTHSGGRWGGAMCCPTMCGEHCGDACTTPECACPSSMIWTEFAGCIPSPMCPELVLCP